MKGFLVGLSPSSVVSSSPPDRSLLRGEAFGISFETSSVTMCSGEESLLELSSRRVRELNDFSSGEESDDLEDPDDEEPDSESEEDDSLDEDLCLVGFSSFLAPLPSRGGAD